MDLSSFRQNNLLYTQESLARYQHGGYHPVSLGDTFKDGRYKVHHKLGWGGFSTVWLAYDRDCQQWVSLKIMTADSQDSRELHNLKLLERRSAERLSSGYIVQLLDSFIHTGPNGDHQCIIFELLGPSVDRVLADYHQGRDTLDPETILRMSKQLLKAVQLIHSAGMCHGDISGRNIAFTCSQLSTATEQQLFDVLEAPAIEPLARIDGMPLPHGLPTHLVKAAEWIDWIDEDDEDIRLLDFGESFVQGQEPHRLAQPGSLRVPETIFTDVFDYRIDLWRAGCMIYSFLFTTYPFWYLGEDEVLVLQMISCVGELPAEWQVQWKDMQASSRHDLEVKDNSESSKLERMFREKVHDEALAHLLPVIQGLMRFLPSCRVTAAEALDLLDRPGIGRNDAVCRDSSGSP